MVKEVINQESAAPAKPFKGYTLDELRYKAALATLHKEFCKDQLLAGLKATLDESPLSGRGKSSGVIGKMLQGLSYIDYALMGFSVFKSVSGIVKFFKKKK